MALKFLKLNFLNRSIWFLIQILYFNRTQLGSLLFLTNSHFFHFSFQLSSWLGVLVLSQLSYALGCPYHFFSFLIFSKNIPSFAAIFHSSLCLLSARNYKINLCFIYHYFYLQPLILKELFIYLFSPLFSLSSSKA